MINIDNKYKMGSYVWAEHDLDCRRMIIGLEVYIDGSYSYKLAGNGKSGYYDERELVKERPLVVDDPV